MGILRQFPKFLHCHIHAFPALNLNIKEGTDVEWDGDRTLDLAAIIITPKNQIHFYFLHLFPLLFVLFHTLLFLLCHLRVYA